MSINDPAHYTVFYTEAGPAHFELDYDENPDHHAEQTCDGVIKLASEWMRRGDLPIRVKDKNLIEDHVLIIEEDGVRLNSNIHASESCYEERLRMYTELWQTWWEEQDYRVIPITRETGRSLFPLSTRTFSSSQRPDILVWTVQVLLGSNFTFTLVERADDKTLRELTIIQNPTDGSIQPIEHQSEHDLSYQLQSHDKGRFHVNVVYKEVAPRRMRASIDPLTLSDL
jgi:hypothetical protein